MHHDLVEKKRWLSEKRFLHALNYCMVLPGPEAQQLATYIGWLMHRTWGGIVAGALFVLPSFFILSSLAWIYMSYGATPAVAGALYGIKPAVVAIVLFAAYRIGARALKNRVMWSIASLAFVAIFVFKLPFPLIILAAGVIGHVGGRKAPHYFALGGGHGTKGKQSGKAMIDDDTPTPTHAYFSLRKMITVALIGLAIWLFVMLGLITTFGWDAALTQMGWFFYQSSLAYLWRCVRSVALCLSGRSGALSVVIRNADDRWLSPRGNYAWATHYGGHLCGLYWRMGESGIWPRCNIGFCHGGGFYRHLLYLFA